MPVRLESGARNIASRATACTDNPLHVLIVGASHGGLALAHGLRRAGISFALYEARRDLADGCPATRAIDEMGIRALKVCLPPDLVATYLAASARAARPVPAPPGNQPLRQLLLTGLTDRVHFGKEFSRYERTADGTVTAFFSDDQAASGRVLVAADGADSAVRAQCLRELVPRRHLSIRGFCPGIDPAAAFPLQITSTELAPAWQASNVTVVGDAIHAVTPGPRAGANTALRDAMLLSRALSFVQDERLSLHNAVAAYETEMVRFDLARVTQPN